MQDLSDDILQKASAGDMKAFEVIYKATSSFVYNVAFRIVNTKEDAEEVTQEVFLSVYHKLNTFRFESSFKTWLYRIAVNYAINFAKKTSKTRNKTVEYEDGVIGMSLSDTHLEIEKEHNQKVVDGLLSAVNPDQRACIVLRNIEGLSYERIAEVLKININTVRSRLKRGREKLLSLKKAGAYEHV